jgi:hypothetical protein
MITQNFINTFKIVIEIVVKNLFLLIVIWKILEIKIKIRMLRFKWGYVAIQESNL